jgi:hypothetical protein
MHDDQLSSIHQKAKRKAKEEEYICVGGACSVCVSLTNFILGMPATD